MPTTITIPDNYGYVALAAISTGFLTAFQTTLVSNALYAEKDEMDKSIEALKFNCAQRAHQNTLEWLPHVLFFTTFLGLRYPTLAASLGGVWSASRVLYTLGYASGDPKKEDSLAASRTWVCYLVLHMQVLNWRLANDTFVSGYAPVKRATGTRVKSKPLVRSWMFISLAGTMPTNNCEKLQQL
ncbi:MAPEG domain-containing protein [Rhizoctonia solani AG-1 IA]|uniref:MAPEG domain-containing protein n=1 Tax=Thanatephorus cucumeris (strain AG1-IA) TaxID=983506 RepID=L8X8U7_THACA|nr:MAPEG domain-containing protein [Rhizoctonia solani AG-1 IA]